jgi:integrase
VSIHKKLNKKGYTYQVRFTRADGRQGSQTFPTKRMAVDFDQRTKVAKRDGLPGLITPSKKPFREYALEYIANSEIEAAPRTTARRTGIVNKYLLPAFGAQPVVRIDRQSIQQQMNKWAISGLSVYSIRNHRQVLREILSLAVKDRVLPSNPVLDVKSPKLPKAQPKFMSPEQFQCLLKEIPHEFQAMVIVAVGTGMRISELIGLNFSNLDLVQGELSIKRSKTKAGIRTIKLGKTLTNVLDNYLKETILLRTDIDGPLFISKRGNRIHDSNFRRRVFNPALKRAGLTEFRFHSFRATSSTWLFQQGVPIPAVMDRVGHESSKTTMDHYVVATKLGKQLAVDAIEGFFAASGATFTNSALSSPKSIRNHANNGEKQQ